ncbi:hypothetical protein RUND412_008511 [Rhizina undulata]
MGSDDESQHSSSSHDAAEVVRIQTALRDSVKRQFKEDSDKATVKYIRSRVEKELGLDQDFLKTDEFWKSESKKIIVEEAEKQNSLTESAQPQTEEEPVQKKKPGRKPATKPAKKAVTKTVDHVEEVDDEDEPPKPSKRGRSSRPAKNEPAKNESARTKAVPKKQKIDEKDTPATHPSPTKSEVLETEPPATPTKRARASLGAAKEGSQKRLKITPEENNENDKDGEGDEAGGVAEQDSESEMSVVLDPTPKKKGRSRSATGDAEVGRKKASNPKAKKSTASSKGKKSTSTGNPDEDKVRQLQQWLTKCGVRKFWARELGKFENPKEKIKHLQSMLSDVGMTGRYSLDKAKKIRERRELLEDVEAVQKGASEWGNESGHKINTRSTRSAPAPNPKVVAQKQIRGLEDLAFLDGQSGDDSD